MERNLPNEEWIKRGCQRRAVVAVLKRPMTTSQILESAKSLAPRIQLRDLWLILKQMQERGLVACLNPDMGNGKLFCPEGILNTSSKTINPFAKHDPDLCSWLHRGSVRREILGIIVSLKYANPAGSTPSEIRVGGARTLGLGKNSVLRAVNELTERRLVKVAPARKRCRQKSYMPTEIGGRVFEGGFY